MENKLRVAVLMGGLSAEYPVSMKSGEAVVRGLRAAGHEVVPIVVRDYEINELDAHEVDVAFIALHGHFGEDGGVQALLESRNIPYTGSGVSASATAMDKLSSKDVFMRSDVPTAPYLAVSRHEQWGSYESWIRKMGFPLVVKPPRQGSSIGTSIVRNFHELGLALDEAFKLDDEALIERYIEGREMTVGILEDRALPIIELKPTREFYDFVAKYQDPSTQYILDVNLEPELYEEVQQTALNAYLALGCEGFGRVDLILGTDGIPYVLEINTIPGFTERSLLPKAAAHAGIPFPELCDRIVQHALTRSAVPTAVATVGALG